MGISYSPTHVAVAAIASAFSNRVRYALAEALPDIVAANRAARAAGDLSTCATHDYCDANELMAEAFREVMGRDTRPDSDADAALWSRAWTLAATRDFYMHAHSEA